MYTCILKFGVLSGYVYKQFQNIHYGIIFVILFLFHILPSPAEGLTIYAYMYI